MLVEAFILPTIDCSSYPDLVFTVSCMPFFLKTFTQLISNELGFKSGSPAVEPAHLNPCNISAFVIHFFS